MNLQKIYILSLYNFGFLLLILGFKLQQNVCKEILTNEHKIPIKFYKHLQGLVSTFTNPQTLLRIFKVFYALSIDAHNSILWSNMYFKALKTCLSYIE
jgi:hypothetical protein